MKRILTIAIAVLMLAMTAFAADNITVTLDGNAIDFADQAPAIVEGRTLVPLRAIFEALGATVEWDQATKTVSSTKDGVSISLAIGSNTLYKNDEAKELDVPAMIIGGRTMVPARAIAEAYGVEVAWDAATRTVVLTQPVVAEPDALPAGTFFNLTGENYTGDEGFKFIAGVNVDPVIVENPDDPSDKVIFVHSEFTEKASWTYFRDYEHVEFKPGEKYLVKFKARLEKRADDLELSEASVGICFRFGDSAEDGSFKDHGVGSVTVSTNQWTDVMFIYTAPETLLPEVGSGFGIYGNPDNGIAISYYLDDVSVSVYTGAAENGFQTKESIEAAAQKESFDFNNAKGVSYDFNEDKDEFFVSGSTPEYVNGHLVMTAEGETQLDPIANFKNVEMFNADEYVAIAVRFKAEGVEEGKDHISVYFATEADPALSQSKCVTVHYKDIDVDAEGYYTAFVSMTGNENWYGPLTALRVDPGNGHGVYTIDKIVVVAK